MIFTFATKMVLVTNRKTVATGKIILAQDTDVPARVFFVSK